MTCEVNGNSSGALDEGKMGRRKDETEGWMVAVSSDSVTLVKSPITSNSQQDQVYKSNPSVSVEIGWQTDLSRDYPILRFATSQRV
jgi:hypothetical protein